MARVTGPATATVATRHGLFSVSTSDHNIGRALFLRGQYQYMLLERACRLLQRFDLLTPGEGWLIDVGAHIGTVAIPLLGQGHFHKALAVEPERLNFELLERNARQNGLENRLVRVCAAAAATDGTGWLRISPRNHGNHQLHDSPGPGEARLVPTRTIDGLLASLDIAPSDVRLLWMDVQGAELDVIRGAKTLISRGIPLVFEFSATLMRRQRIEVDTLSRRIADAGGVFTHAVDLRDAQAGPVKLDALPVLLKPGGVRDILLFSPEPGSL